MTGYTVVTAEPEWDMWASRRALALTFYDDTHCSACGNDLHLSSDPEVARHGVNVDDTMVCWTCAAKEQHQRQLHERHKDDPGYFDGRSLIATLVAQGGRP